MSQLSLLPLQHRVAASAQTTCSSCLLKSLGFQKQLRPGSQRAYNRAVAVAAAAPVPVDQIPRQPGVSDGAWDAADAAAVKEALRDGQQAASISGRTGPEILLGRSLPELQLFAKERGQPAYRGKQLYDGLLHGVHNVLDFNNVPKAWREQLAAEGTRSGRSRVYREVRAADGTRKFLLQLADGHVVETVGIPLDNDDKHSLTCCVSSQVGCPMRCTFCATGSGGFSRNLMASEIVDQVLTVQEHFATRVSNVVLMGMGEPLLNLRAVSAAALFLNRSLGVGARHITLSTVGVPNAIGMLADALLREQLQITLAVSLHAPDQALRQQIVPSAKAYPLHALLADCAAFFERTGRRVTFEYTLLDGFNDSVAQAEELAATLRSARLGGSHVNLIPWNAVSDNGGGGPRFATPSRNRVRAFRDALEHCGVPVSIRTTRGLDAGAACGQLRNEHQKKPMEPALRQQLA